MNGMQRVSDRDIWNVVESMLNSGRDRETYLWGVLQDFAYAVAKLAANPATLIDGPEEEGCYGEAGKLVVEWAKRSANELDELLASMY
jgi:hypothetical protein